MMTITASVADDVYDALTSYMAEHNVTLDEAIRRAVSHLHYIDGVYHRHGTILVSQPDGVTYNEVLFE